MPNDVKCGFCGRPRNEVKGLIPNQKETDYICNFCVMQGAAALQANTTSEEPEAGPLPKPLEILSRLDEYVIGQSSAKQALAAAVYKHYRRREALQAGVQLEFQKSNIMIAGPSGVGKTEIARTLARLLDVPFFVADATRMTQAGYAGDNIETTIQGLLEACAWDVERAEWGIVVIDEIDKLRRSSGRDVAGYRDVSGEGVQQALLKLTEGGEILVDKQRGGGVMVLSQQNNNQVKFNTSNVLFIGMGAFSGIDDVIDRRLNQATSLGFGGRHREKFEAADLYKKLDEVDALEFGIIPELAGRFPILTSVLPLTEDELVRILTEPKNAIIKQFQALYAMDNMDLQFDEDALKAIARKAQSRKTGARALRGILETLMNPYDLRLPSEPDVRSVRVTEAFVEGKGGPEIIRGELQVHAEA